MYLPPIRDLTAHLPPAHGREEDALPIGVLELLARLPARHLSAGACPREDFPQDLQHIIHLTTT